MSDAQWFFGRGGSQGGPVTDAALRQMLASGELRGTDLAWRDGMAQWQPIAEVAELAGAVPPATAAPLRPPPLPTPVGYAGPYAQGPPGQRSPDIGQDAGMRMLLPVGRSGWAIASGYMGLLSFFPFVGLLFGVVAIITGALAIKDIKRHPERHGMGRAIFGIVAGVLFVVVWGIALFAALAANRGVRRF